jgi:hypothetical protein
MSENNYFKYLVGGLLVAGLGTGFAMKKAVDSWRQYKIEKRIAMYYGGRITENIVKINPDADLQIVFNNFKTEDFSKDSERVLLARMILGEAEKCSDLEKISVAYVAINRANDGKKWNGETLKESILKPYQFSCFNKELFEKVNGKIRKRINSRLKHLNDPMNYNPKEFKQCLILSGEILGGKYSDPTNGATFYYNPKTIDSPKWAGKLKRVKVPGTVHWFFKEK